MKYDMGTLVEFPDEDPRWLSVCGNRREYLNNPGFKRELYVYLLTPGFTMSYHQQALACNADFVRSLVKEAEPFRVEYADLVQDNIGSVTLSDALRMNKFHGGWRPYWVQQLARDQVKRIGRKKTCELFGVSSGTLHRWVSGLSSFDPVSGENLRLSEIGQKGRKWRKTAKN